MSDLRLSDLGQITGPIDRAAQNVLLDDATNTHRALLKQLFGSGSGAANRLAFKEEITEITAEMFASIADGSFDKVHVGMHYTAPSGRSYWFAHADYYFGMGDQEQTNHHMIVVEDKINGHQQHQTTNVTTGGAASSLIYTTYLPAHQSELEADFGASHIISQRLYLSNAVSNGIAAGGAWVSKSAALMNLNQVMGHGLGYTEGSGQYFNSIERERQFALFAAMPETVIARDASTNARDWWWTDDVISASYFGGVYYSGLANSGSASVAYGVRRAFLIG